MAKEYLVLRCIVLTALTVLSLSHCKPLYAVALTITKVVESGGDDEMQAGQPFDTIVAKWTGQTWNATVANEPVPGAVVGNPYTMGTFGHLAPAYVDRAHRYYDDIPNNLPIPAYLVGKEYIMSGNDNRDNANYRLDVMVNDSVRVYMLIDNRLGDADGATPPQFDATHMQWILDQGWAPTTNGLNRKHDAAFPDEVPIDEGADGTVNQYFSVYYKNFPAGTFSLFQADNTGQNMYGVLVMPMAIPEPSTLVLGALGLAGICLAHARRTRRRAG